MLRPRQLVLATGMSGVPNVPEIPGADTFQGEHHHSSQFRGVDDYRGKKCVVLGSNNSAHDICAALWEQGADVTMIQRSSTHVARSDTLMELALGRLYSEAAVDRRASRQTLPTCCSPPSRIASCPRSRSPSTRKSPRRDADLYERLERAGFLLDFGDDGSGLFMKYLRRGSGYYIDVGALELVSNY